METCSWILYALLLASLGWNILFQKQLRAEWHLQNKYYCLVAWWCSCRQVAQINKQTNKQTVSNLPDSYTILQLCNGSCSMVLNFLWRVYFLQCRHREAKVATETESAVPWPSSWSAPSSWDPGHCPPSPSPSQISAWRIWVRLGK